MLAPAGPNERWRSQPSRPTIGVSAYFQAGLCASRGADAFQVEILPGVGGFRIAWWPAAGSTESSAGWNWRTEFCPLEVGCSAQLLGSWRFRFHADEIGGVIRAPAPSPACDLGVGHSGRVRATPLAGFDPLLNLVPMTCSGAMPSSTQRSKALPITYIMFAFVHVGEAGR